MSHEGHMDHSAMGHGEGHAGHGGMQMQSLSLPVATAWVVFSFVVLFAAMIVTNIYVPIRF